MLTIEIVSDLVCPWCFIGLRRLSTAIAEVRAGASIGDALAVLQGALLANGFSQVDYAEFCDASSLAPLTALTDAPARLLVAARIGGTRLIDNMAV